MGVEALPELHWSLAGRPLDERWSTALASMQVRARLGLPRQCELLFDGEALGAVEDGGWRQGSALRIGVADASNPSLFDGDVAAVEQVYGAGSGRWIRIRAYDALYRLGGRQSVRGHRHLDIAELAQELVAKDGLKVKARSPGVSRPFFAQHRQTDLELLRWHAAALGLYAAVEDGILHLFTLEGSGERYALEQGENLIESRFDAASRGWAVAAGYAWDPATGQACEAAARGQSAGSWHAGQGELALVDLALENGAQVEAACRAELDRAAGRALSFWGHAAGDPALRPGVVAQVSGVDPMLCGGYVLTSVRHLLDRRRGFVSEISSYPPKAPEACRGTEFVPGFVTSVDDPDRRGRVKVSLPTFAALETDWLRVVAPGLGRDRGFIAVPDVGDEVAVALTHGDPARGLVLGGIFDGRGKLDAGVEGGRVRRFQLRAGDQVLELDQKRGSIRLENGSGSSLELTSKGISLRASGALRLEAPGKRLRLRASRIDMDKA